MLKSACHCKARTFYCKFKNFPSDVMRIGCCWDRVLLWKIFFDTSINPSQLLYGPHALLGIFHRKKLCQICHTFTWSQQNNKDKFSPNKLILKHNVRADTRRWSRWLLSGIRLSWSNLLETDWEETVLTGKMTSNSLEKNKNIGLYRTWLSLLISRLSMLTSPKQASG